jgi:DNA recombination protein RmuC
METPLLIVLIVLVLAVGVIVLAILKRSGAGASGPVQQQLERVSDRFNETLRSSALDTQTRLNEAFGGLKTSINSDLATGRKESAEALGRTTTSLEGRFERLQTSNEARLQSLQDDNSKKLDQMRAVVEEKLQKTLETRLGESFKLVSDRLELVHKGLGEMQALAGEVGDLKKVLTNVKTRGTWGEVQLGNLLEQVLTAEQYATNVETKPGSGKRVEFAIRLPGRDAAGEDTVWLPIDAKFPQEDYQRLVDAQERADPAAADAAGKQLEARVKLFAREIRDKYIAPPATTDFALMFLPVEGLYAEMLRRPGLADTLQREFRVVIAGPTTLAALLNSLQMGFRTLAIEKRSSEVWKLLAAVKSEFGKFGVILDKAHRQLETVSNSIDTASRKTRTITRRLREVEQLPESDARAMLGADDTDTSDEEGDDA